jgi:hypothetical protein
VFQRKSFLGILGVLGLLWVGAAQAVPPYVTGTKSGSGWGGTWGSTIECTAIGTNADSNMLDFNTFNMQTMVHCRIQNGTTVEGDCTLDITYSNPDAMADVATCDGSHT